MVMHVYGPMLAFLLTGTQLLIYVDATQSWMLSATPDSI